MNAPTANHIELFRYLRTLIDTTENDRSAYPQFALVEAYWHIGRIVVETEQDGAERADYGIHLIEQLSQHLSAAFGKGYSLPNMWRFKQFYLAFPMPAAHGNASVDLRQYLRTELTWSHYRLLMTIKNRQERAFYIQQAADDRWTVRFLQKLVRSRYYYQAALGEESLLSSPKKIVQYAPIPMADQQPTNYRTRLAGIRKLMLERYVGYAFVAQRQFVSVQGTEQWVELVFFHIVLQRYVLIQLGEHTPSSSASFAQLVDAYITKQPPTLTKSPIGLLIDQQGAVNVISASFEMGLPADERALLPQTLRE
ncbi:PDDEXK nuclease domain-containing protein [Spirosoma agri]|uniref:DUF1016 domain-containing protein n=1 Tax=Spirosoma agri TaxID=1987381 RepID=A0A6M0IRT8_9BACT|nr:PDDEXK nuclease domain-containing protein [Spirosoma agri]NEU70647.1 DUF1016 domain-containing protein [Spirosoma agri]